MINHVHIIAVLSIRGDFGLYVPVQRFCFYPHTPFPNPVVRYCYYQFLILVLDTKRKLIPEASQKKKRYCIFKD